MSGVFVMHHMCTMGHEVRMIGNIIIGSHAQPGGTYTCSAWWYMWSACSLVAWWYMLSLVVHAQPGGTFSAWWYMLSLVVHAQPGGTCRYY
jgi:hypothetical protein